MLFTVPSRYWFPIGRLPYLALGRGRPGFPPDSACRKVLTLRSHPCPPPVTYGTLTPSGRPFQCRSVKARTRASGRYPAPDQSYYPRTAARTSSCAARVWAPPVSLAATPGILSSPQGTEMFQFPQCPPIHPDWYPGCPGWVAPFGYLWITRYQPVPRAFRGVVTSFLGSRRLGIHHALIFVDRPRLTEPRSRPGPCPARPPAAQPISHLPSPAPQPAPGPVKGGLPLPRDPVTDRPHLSVSAVEPRGFEPRTSAVQRRRSPS